MATINELATSQAKILGAAQFALLSEINGTWNLTVAYGNAGAQATTVIAATITNGMSVDQASATALAALENPRIISAVKAGI